LSAYINGIASGDVASLTCSGFLTFYMQDFLLSYHQLHQNNSIKLL